MQLIRSAILRVPAIRRLRDSHDRLIAELADARERLRVAEEHEARVSARLTGAEEEKEDVAAMYLARQEGRLFITDYPYFPRQRPIEEAAGGRQVAARFQRDEAAIAATIRGIARHVDTLIHIPREQDVQLQPFWANDWFPPFDGAALYGLIAENAPRRYIEVGSGISTRFARQAVRDLGLATRIVSIDPHPHNTIEGLCDETIVQRMEDMSAEFWAGLNADDMLFIDNSHRSFPSSDVTVFFTEVMPALPPGVVYGIHDIFLPWDYPEEWRDRFYSEQYLLMTYLLGGGGDDQILLPVYWAGRQPELHGLLAVLWNRTDLFGRLMTHGGAFWARRGGRETCTVDLPENAEEIHTCYDPDQR